MIELVEQVGPYTVVSELGRGGMGVVFAGRGPDGRQVAIKLLRDEATDRSLARFHRERRLLASLSDTEGFVPLLDSGETPEGPFIVMPLYQLGTLRGRLVGKPMDVKWTVSLGERLARTLGRAHGQGIVHRDMKPENVLFGDDGLAHISDLGLAKHYSPAGGDATRSESLSKPGDFIGTAGYMSPEQLRDAKGALPASDVFALGAILYECLTGKRCFDGESIFQVVAKIQRHEIEPIAQVRKDVPSWLVRVVERALAHDPALRYANGADLAQALAARGRAPLDAKTVAVRGAVGAVLCGASVVAVLVLRQPSTPPPRTLHGDQTHGSKTTRVGAAPTTDGPVKIAQARVREERHTRHQSPAAPDEHSGTDLSFAPAEKSKAGSAMGFPVLVKKPGTNPNVYVDAATLGIGTTRTAPARAELVVTTPDGSLVATVTSESATVRLSETRVVSRRIDAADVAFAGSSVVAAMNEPGPADEARPVSRAALLWDPATNAERFLEHPSRVSAVGGGVDLALTGCEDGLVRLWYIADGELAGELRVAHAVVALGASSTRVVVATDEEVRVFRRNGEALARLAHEAAAVAIAEDGAVALVGSDEVTLLDPDLKRPRTIAVEGVIAVHFSGGKCFALTRSGRRVEL